MWKKAYPTEGTIHFNSTSVVASVNLVIRVKIWETNERTNERGVVSSFSFLFSVRPYCRYVRTYVFDHE